MCIIVAKPINSKVPDFNILENCFNNNPDGAGYMYLNKNQVIIKKGFMTFEAMKKSLEDTYNTLDNLLDIPFVYHFRIGTSGGNIPENTHPYPLKRNIKEFKKLENTCKIGVAHNGVISRYTPSKSNKHHLNDTQIYIYKKMSKYNFFKKDISKIKNLVSKETSSKFAILTYNTNNIKLIGDFIEDNGIFYSNSSYKKRTYYDYNFDFNRFMGYYNYRDLEYTKEQDFYDVLAVANYIKTNQVIYQFEYDEYLQPSSNYDYIELDDKIYFADYENQILEFITDFYEILPEEEFENLYNEGVI